MKSKFSFQHQLYILLYSRQDRWSVVVSRHNPIVFTVPHVERLKQCYSYASPEDTVGLIEFRFTWIAYQQGYNIWLPSQSKTHAFKPTCRSCLADSAPARVLNVTKPTGWRGGRTLVALSCFIKSYCLFNVETSKC